MNGRVAILGATGGIGAALARRVAAGGATPVLLARDPIRLQALAAEIPGAESRVVDVLDSAALKAALTGPLSGLVFCVGSIVLKPFARSTETDFNEAFRLNVVAAAMAVQAAAAELVKAQGAVVLFSSIAARTGFGLHAVIGSAKAAVEGLTVAIAAELSPDVRVNCIAPSLTRTRIAEPLTRNAQMADAIAKLHPIPRLGEPDELAALAAFLLGPDAGWISGQIIAVDGGRSSLRGKGGT